MKRLKCKLTGKAPLLMHNGQLSDPTYHYSKELKVFTSKRKKTEADFEAMSKIEWFGGLYIENKKIVIPGQNVERMLVDGAKKERLGRAFSSGVFVEKNFVLEYEGPNDPEKLYENSDFVNKTSVVVQKSRVIRTRPIFKEWALDIEVLYDPGVVNLTSIKTALKTAGDLIGLGDWRPRYGRFDVKFL